MILKDKHVIIFGERDDVPAPSIRRCIEAAGGQVVYEATACFV